MFGLKIVILLTVLIGAFTAQPSIPTAQALTQAQAQAECSGKSGYEVRTVSGGNPEMGQVPDWGCVKVGTSITDPGGGTKCTFSTSTWDLCISNIIYVFTVGIGSTFAFIGAYFFDVAVSLALNSLAYAQDFISKGWTMARDLANMGFILALVYIAYTVLLKAESGGTMRMLAWVVVMALIINFSFFFTRLVIDAGNILAVQFYNAIPTQQTLAQTLQGTTGGGAVAGATEWLANNNNTLGRTKDLTHPIMNGLNMQGLFSTAIFDQWYAANKDISGWINVLLTLSFIYIAVGAMYFILAVMFLAAGIKFLARIVVLWFLIVASPLAFLAKTTRLSEKYYDLWQRYLIMHTFYPVVFLFIFLFISLVMNDLNPGNASGGLTNSIIGDLTRLQALSAGSTASAISIVAASIANVAIRLGFVVAMLYIGMRAADKMGVMGATAAGTFTNWVSRRGTGAFFGGSAWAMRNTAGLAGTTFAKSGTGRNIAANGGILGRTLWRGANTLSKQNFDARGLPGIRTGLSKIGVDTNPANTTSYQASFDARVKKREEEANRLKTANIRDVAKANKNALNNVSQADINELNKLKGEQEKARKERATLQKELKNAKTEQETQKFTTLLQAKVEEIKEKEEGFKEKEKQVTDKIKDDIARATGGKNAAVYATSLDTRSWRNAWGTTSIGVPGYISAADQEAAAKIRGTRGESESLKDLMKKAQAANSPLTRQSLDATQQQAGSLEKATGALIKGLNQKISISSNSSSQNSEMLGAVATSKILKEMRGESVQTTAARSTPPLQTAIPKPTTSTPMTSPPPLPTLESEQRNELGDAISTFRKATSEFKEATKEQRKITAHIASIPAEKNLQSIKKQAAPEIRIAQDQIDEIKDNRGDLK